MLTKANTLNEPIISLLPDSHESTTALKHRIFQDLGETDSGGNAVDALVVDAGSNRNSVADKIACVHGADILVPSSVVGTLMDGAKDVHWNWVADKIACVYGMDIRVA